ncbi:methyltransferase domain-containing protein [Actinophytocola algeriensis]|uniref:S-adenosylmethionine-dependent methyltransferase n=1 Tax=Actinophytocola algeriensis TaxID=1768010 RepID=A0A7W7Q0T3_9PSEU|nr:methyltransferase domain-containing protein [Actinophytocola algeriensis]MBB4904895.1 S-adenosylmethionine-dependent methyltransferase [Actinophytocola algeriensis]MBE1476245.1 S-adenosylmethionine-dependent methyltransferase [Actinophytocola algeriensis]
MTLSGFETRREWRLSPLDRLRHTVTEANLARHLGQEPARVLDVAGGNGMAAVRLAAQGHEVTVLDPAGAMLRAAIDAADAHGVADRLHVVQAAAHDAPEVFTDHDFDLVLCHNLLHYAESPDERRAVLAAITAPLRPGGLLSVLGPNEDFGPAQAVLRDRSPALALRELDGGADEWSTPGTVGEVVATLAELGMEEIVRYGVRCVSDLIAEQDAADPGFMADLERLELALSNRMPHLLTARYYHLVARR